MTTTKTAPAMKALVSLPRKRTPSHAFSRLRGVKHSWPRPEESVGRFISFVGSMSCWEAIGPAREAFYTIGSEIKRHLDAHNEPAPTWITWSIYMIGDQPKSASPAIIFCSENESYRKSIRDTVKESRILDAHPGITLKHLPRAPDYTHLVQLASQPLNIQLENPPSLQNQNVPPLVFSTTPDPAIGDALFIQTSSDASTIRRATAGGTILFGYSTCLMTAAHAFSEQLSRPSDDDRENEELLFSDSDEDLSATSRASNSSETSDSDDEGRLESLQSSGRPSITTPQDSSATPSDLLVALRPELPQQQRRLSIAKDIQNTLDEVTYDRTSVGNLLFTSFEGQQPELDYALVWTKTHGGGPRSDTKRPSDSASHALFSCDYTKAQDFLRLGSTSVTAHTASNGTVAGHINLTPVFMRVPNMKNHQIVYSVQLTKSLSNGDCGSWVYDALTGLLHGHIIAGTAIGDTAFCVPAYQVAEDIEVNFALIESRLENYGENAQSQNDAGWSLAEETVQPSESNASTQPADITLWHNNTKSGSPFISPDKGDLISPVAKSASMSGLGTDVQRNEASITSDRVKAPLFRVSDRDKSLIVTPSSLQFHDTSRGKQIASSHSRDVLSKPTKSTSKIQGSKSNVIEDQIHQVFDKYGSTRVLKLAEKPTIDANGGTVYIVYKEDEVMDRGIEELRELRSRTTATLLSQSDSVDGLHDQLPARLRVTPSSNSNSPFEQIISFETIHFIHTCAEKVPIAYLDEPTWHVQPGGEIVLKGQFPIHDVAHYIHKKQDLAFLVAKIYIPRDQEQEVLRALRDKRKVPRLRPSGETIRLQSQHMIETMEIFWSSTPAFKKEAPQFNARMPLAAPYLFWYRHRSSQALRSMGEVHRQCMERLTGWIDDHYNELYDRVTSQITRNVVSFEAMEFLIRPGDALVSLSDLNQDGASIKAAIATASPISLPGQVPSEEDANLQWTQRSQEGQKKYTWKWVVSTWVYKFDGSFYQQPQSMEIELKADTIREEVDIKRLSAYPLKYAEEETRLLLERRGNIFWSCRTRRLVSYADATGIYDTAERYMVDFQTYRQLHSHSPSFKRQYHSSGTPEIVRMDARAGENDGPPLRPEIYVFPPTIPGYNLREKKWVDLKVEMIRDVIWNKESFKHLVIDNEIKELVQAVITNQIAKEQSTDIMKSKGNGLVMLLHGPPGTGKTFTAETVAEIAERPLFRVTCGDMGTASGTVEKYLESVLYLSKRWGCIVLLDEADVYLEQRGHADLERNALVTIFLRVLEYYEGIMILTTNRVGTFDEAFKSRIQLALHFGALTTSQRHRVWKNFLNRLDEVTNEIGSIDFDDIADYLPELAAIEMNGRQIRNVITTARQLAMFKLEQMGYRHLKHVISISGQFEKYLVNTREGLSEEEIARANGIR